MKNILAAAALAAAATAPLAEGNHTVLGVYPSPAYLDPAAARSAEAVSIACQAIRRSGGPSADVARAYAEYCQNQPGRPVSEPPHSTP